MTDSRLDRRRAHLRDAGASGRVAAEIIGYDDTPYGRTSPGPLPLVDEPHAADWSGYQRAAAAEGVFETLRQHLVQLRFPVRTGMSEDEAYRRATRRGDTDAADAFAPGLTLNRPDAVRLDLAPSMGGAVPVIVAEDRSDFVALVRALTSRNEPVDVPDAMGACFVKGLNNWSRVAAHRAAWATTADDTSDDGWATEFQQLIPQKALYQDRLIILSRGPYSATSHVAAGLSSEAEWLDASVAIRREHELTHYFTYRVFGSMRSHVVDELVADFIGLQRGFGGYRAALALRFLGLEGFPAYRAGGRLEHYLGNPPLSDEAFEVVQKLTVRAAHNLETLDIGAGAGGGDLEALGRLTLGLVTLTLEELASPDLAELIEEAPS